MAETQAEKRGVNATTESARTDSERQSRPSSMHILPQDLEEYFRGPIDVDKHSKWPFFMRLHGSILPKMIIPLLFLGAWSTLITCLGELGIVKLQIQSTLLTVTGFVVGLALSFRSSTAYERFSEGRKYWAQLLLNCRNMARLIWVHIQERHGEDEELGKKDLLAKLAALNLLNAFAVSLKHRLRFEPSVEYPDLQPLISHLHTFAGNADQAPLRETRVSCWKSTGQSLGLSFAESNPRKLVKRSKENLGNTPLEVLNYLGAYLEGTFRNATCTIGHQSQVMGYMVALTDVLTGAERVVNTPLPIAYSISIAQITWAYVVVLPFQLTGSLGWVAIPGTILAGYIILGIAQIGRELENPFGQDTNDLPLDAYCRELANDIDSLTANPAPLNNEEWMKDTSAKLLWPYSGLEYSAWEAKSTDEIREALRNKASSKETKIKRIRTMFDSKDMAAKEDGAAQTGRSLV